MSVARKPSSLWPAGGSLAGASGARVSSSGRPARFDENCTRGRSRHGPLDKRYYYKDLGLHWRAYFLNSEIAHGVGSAQYNWLQSHLSAAPKPCTIAIWHKPLFTSGTAHGGDTSMRAFWQLLYQARAELVLNGHNHQYERFAKQRPDGTYDPANGVREVVVGTGGAGLYRFGTPKPNSQVRNGTVWGVLKLRLDDDRRTYHGRFLPKAGQTFTDEFSASCSP